MSFELPWGFERNRSRGEHLKRATAHIIATEPTATAGLVSALGRNLIPSEVGMGVAIPIERATRVATELIQLSEVAPETPTARDGIFATNFYVSR